MRSLDRVLTIYVPDSAENKVNWDVQDIRLIAQHIEKTSINSETKDALQMVEFGLQIGFSLMISSELRGLLNEMLFLRNILWWFEK